MSHSPELVHPSPERRSLDSWKEIAAHLGRTVRTVQRWERDEQLPVHRHLHQRQSSIYAFTDELDAWWRARRETVEAREGALDLAAADSAPPRSEAHPPGASGNPSAPSGRTWGVHSRWRWLLGGAMTALALALLAGAPSLAPLDATPAPAGGPSADDLYAEGRDHWNERTPRGFEQARRTFEAALAADPRHARSHAGLADTYSLLEAFGLMAADQALPRARAAAERALQLDPDLGEAHASLSFVLWELRDTAGAMAEARRAIELDPNYATAHHWYSLFLQQFLRRDEAIAEGRTAVDLDPSRPILWTDLAGLLRNDGRIREAKEVLEQARARHPAFPDIYVQLAEIARSQGREADAVRLMRSAVALGDNRARIIAILGCLESRTGHAAGAEEALSLLRDVEASGQHVPDDAYATLLAVTGDHDGAFARIQLAMDERQEWVGGIGSLPCFSMLLSDSRWPALAARLDNLSWVPPGGRTRPRSDGSESVGR